MYLLYDALLLPFAPVAAAAVRLPAFRRHAERLGRYDVDWRARLGDRRVLWLHAASVGELLAARRLAGALRTAFPEAALVASTTSFAGRDLAVRMPEMDGALLLPLDFPAAIDRAIDALRPTAFVFTETEIWPNLLRAFARRGIPAVLLSGRVSPRAFRRYRRIRFFLRRVLAHVAAFGMQTEAEAERIRELGAPADRVVVTGSLKLEGAVPPPSIELGGEGPLWIAASTHDPEEAICLRVFERLRRRFPALRLLLAPRHLRRQADVEALLSRAESGFARRSALDGRWSGDPPVLLLDTLGELAGLFPQAAVAFVGGSLAPVGGHNLVEPARAGVPTLVGPHVEAIRETADRLRAAGAVDVVAGEAELEARLASLLDAPAERRRMGEAARAAFSSAGALEASLDLVRRVLERHV